MYTINLESMFNQHWIVALSITALVACSVPLSGLYFAFFDGVSTKGINDAVNSRSISSGARYVLCSLKDAHRAILETTQTVRKQQSSGHESPVG